MYSNNKAVTLRFILLFDYQNGIKHLQNIEYKSLLTGDRDVNRYVGRHSDPLGHKILVSQVIG